MSKNHRNQYNLTIQRKHKSFWPLFVEMIVTGLTLKLPAALHKNFQLLCGKTSSSRCTFTDVQALILQYKLQKAF